MAMEMEAWPLTGFRDWARLPPDPLTRLGDLLNIAGRACFRSVCLSWSAALPAEPAMPQPWLLIAPRPLGHDDTHAFVSLPAERAFRRTLPAGIHCIGSSAGWLALVDVSLHIMLLYPLTDAQVRLPPLRRQGRLTPLTYAPDGSVATFLSFPPLLGPSVPAQLLQRHEIRKVAFSLAPSEQDYAVAVLCRLWHGLAFTRAGSDGWQWLEWPIQHLTLNVPAHYPDYDRQDLSAFVEQTAPYPWCNYDLDIVYQDGKFSSAGRSFLVGNRNQLVLLSPSSGGGSWLEPDSIYYTNNNIAPSMSPDVCEFYVKTTII